MAGLVETSTSLGEAIDRRAVLTLHSLSRSSNDSAMPEVIATLDGDRASRGRRARGEAQLLRLAAPTSKSHVLSLPPAGCTSDLFGEEAIVTGVHAGLETAVIGGKVPGLDMLSFGPQIEFPHSPDERVSIPTVERFWRLLVAFVDEISKPAVK